ncbi:hypothetical protein I4641_17420 [Waterburya agarophytonicola K14]|uniref:Uncharacterized protein n=1 Tax=Waterburya agarophytonicola KI4 TaxID=2874699 RepID=A0A964FKG9_9CYAN|nr:hypothetical protein [Waterburya agarophytonicola]MCC0178753.1 hypothetical protein [Waterburya agarophytonicola KI4]
MEDMMFGLVLFVVYYIVLVWLYAPAVESDEGAWEVNQDGEIVHHNDNLTVPTVKPIEQQLKDVLWSENEEVTETVIEVEQKPTVEELLDGVEIDKITLRKARKIASALGIKQKVNNRDHKKAFLVAQIAKRLRANPEMVAPIIAEKVLAA